MIVARRLLRPAISAVVLALAVGACGGDIERQARPSDQVVIETDSGTVRVDVEIADTSWERTVGLMGRRHLPPEAGMAFLWSEPTQTGFTMRNTLIPLSVALWGADGRILRIYDMEPCKAEPCPAYYDPNIYVVGAVEVNQGFFGDHGVEIGDRVRLERSAG